MNSNQPSVGTEIGQGTYLTRKESSGVVGVAETTWRNWAHLGIDPVTALHVGGIVLYRLEDVQRFADAYRQGVNASEYRNA